MKIWFVVLILIFSLIQSQNLPQMPNTSRVINGPSYVFTYYITDSDSIIIQIRFNGYNYFALAYQKTMINTDMSILTINGGNILLGEYYSTSTSAPDFENHNILSDIFYDTDNNSYITVQFTRPLNPNIPKLTVLNKNKSFDFAIAWSSQSYISYHQNNISQVAGILSNLNSNTNNPPPQTNSGNNNSQIPISQIDPQVKTHGLLLTLSWFLFSDLAAFFITYRYRKYTYWVHAILMTISVGLSLLVGILMLKSKGGFTQMQNLTISQKSHLSLGVVCLLWFVFQIVFGIIVRVIQYFSFLQPKILLGFVWIHRQSGFIIIIIAKVNVLIGWYMTNTAIFGILIVDAILMISLFVLKNVKERKISGIVYTPQSILTILNNQKMHELLLKHPYNSPELTHLKYIIFNDYVWDLSEKYGFHPGGNKILEVVNGREIDRFIYGMNVPQEFSYLNKVVHSRKSLYAIDSPIFRLATHKNLFNANSILDQTQFILISKQEFSPGIWILQFKSIRQRLYFHRPQALTYLGQYYTIVAFGRSRLYSSIISIRMQNREYVENILIKQGYAVDKIKKKKIRLHSEKDLDLGSIPSQRIMAKVQLEGESIPLIIKKCHLTDSLLSQKEVKLTIGGQHGRGISFDKIQPGKVIIITGGTGINPFLDLFDLIFKDTLIRKQKQDFNTIIQTNPIFKANPKILDGFTFVVYSAFNQLSQVFNRSLLQFLCVQNQQRFSMTMRIKIIDEKTKVTKKLMAKNKIRFTQSHFNLQFAQKNIINSQSISMVYICGPERMNIKVLEILNEMEIDKSKIYMV